MEQSASTIKHQLEEAGRFSEKQYKGTLDKLRSMGPVGQAVAKELKEKLVGAGELAEESIDDVIKTLKAIDPAAADAAPRNSPRNGNRVQSIGQFILEGVQLNAHADGLGGRRVREPGRATIVGESVSAGSRGTAWKDARPTLGIGGSSTGGCQELIGF